MRCANVPRTDLRRMLDQSDNARRVSRHVSRHRAQHEVRTSASAAVHVSLRPRVRSALVAKRADQRSKIGDEGLHAAQPRGHGVSRLTSKAAPHDARVRTCKRSFERSCDFTAARNASEHAAKTCVVKRAGQRRAEFGNIAPVRRKPCLIRRKLAQAPQR